ncbi:MAG TPA: ATP-binding cassette domain-containing protein [Acidimicrobiales bacterium]|nr:ATP-binding cassette domain-containing protein [Acidimicrobiales bacterium]
MSLPVLSIEHVDVYRGGTQALRSVDWQVSDNERWVVLGPNGCGKTTLLSLISGYLHPSRGRVMVLGATLGRTDVRALRQRIGLVSASIGHKVPPHLTAHEVVVSGRFAALEPWWHSFSAADHEKAATLLANAGFPHILERPFQALSEGERQQVLLARALMGSPDLVLLDEPCAGLDMGGRERLLKTLADLAANPGAPPTIMVTHHIEEVPQHFTHGLLMRSGAVEATGPLEHVFTAQNLSACFDLPLQVQHRAGRWTTRARS